jgi:predicted ATPase
MIIQRVEISGHPGLGTLMIDLLDTNGGEFDSIIIAGGNGTGKSTILELIQRAIEGGLGGDNVGKISLTIRLNDKERAILDSAGSGLACDQRGIIEFSYDSSITNKWSAYSIAYKDTNGAMAQVQPYLNNSEWGGLLSAFYSEAALNFNPGQLTSATASDIATGQDRVGRSGEEIAPQIAQLLVNVRAADAEEVTAWVEANPDLAPPSSVKDRRFSRFRRAFSYMFPAKRFKGISRRGNNIIVEFEEYGKTVPIDKLSSGEKQIVFRAGFLLRELANLSSSVVLIDEPELSLHPEWQEKILQFYKTILSDEHGKHPQIIIATHSPFIVHGAAGAKVVILEKDSTGIVAVAQRPSYVGASGMQAVTAFNLNSFLAAAKHPVLILCEGSSDAALIDLAWSRLRHGKSKPYEAWPALGDRNISITLNDTQVFKRIGNRSLIGLFDFDTAYNQWKGVWKSCCTSVSTNPAQCLIKKRNGEKGWAFLLPVPSHRVNYASQLLAGNSILSIEFLFEDKDIPSYMIDHRNLPNNLQLPFFKDSEKTAFSMLASTLPGSAFLAFEPLIKRIEDVANGHI